MNWQLAAGLAQLALIAWQLVAWWRAGRRRTGDLIIRTVPMTGLAIATLVGAEWALAVAAIFYSVWLVNCLLAWLRPDGSPNTASPGGP